jgi:hypothetical protein
MRVIGSLVLAMALVGCGARPQSETGPKLTLSWPAAPGAEEYVIERVQTGVFREIARVPATRTEYVDRTVQAGVEYCYQVRARNRYGISPPTAQRCGTPKP